MSLSEVVEAARPEDVSGPAAVRWALAVRCAGLLELAEAAGQTALAVKAAALVADLVGERRPARAGGVVEAVNKLDADLERLTGDPS